MLQDKSSTPVAPDGGYGWVVLVMAFVGNAITIPTNTFFGILLVELPVAFDQSKNAVSWINSIRVGVSGLVGIIAGGLVDVYECRTTCIIGGILQATGYFLSSFAPNICTMYLTYGLMAGMGFGLTLVASMVIVQQYFNLRRPFAAGIAVSGISVGGLVLVPCYQLLCANYGWRGAVLVLSALHLNLIACGLAFIPLSATTKSLRMADGNRGGTMDELTVKNNELKLHMTGQKYQDNTSGSGIHQGAGYVSAAQINVADEERGKEILGNESMQADKQLFENFRTINNRDAKQERNSNGCLESNCLALSNSRLLKNFRDTSLLKEFDFILIAFAFAMSDTWISVIFTMLYGYGLQKGASATVASLLLSVCAFGTLLSRLASSVVANLNCVNRSLFYSLSFLFGGLVLALSFLSGNSVYALAVFSFLYGLSIGAFNAVAVTNLSDLFGVQRVAKSFGWIQTLSAFFAFTALPTVGLIVDKTNNYGLVYAVIGIVYLTCGILALVPYIRRARRRAIILS